MIGGFPVLINPETAWTLLYSSSFREFTLSTLLDISVIRFACSACQFTGQVRMHKLLYATVTLINLTVIKYVFDICIHNIVTIFTNISLCLIGDFY